MGQTKKKLVSHQNHQMQRRTLERERRYSKQNVKHLDPARIEAAAERSRQKSHWWDETFTEEPAPDLAPADDFADAELVETSQPDVSEITPPAPEKIVMTKFIETKQKIVSTIKKIIRKPVKKPKP